MELILKQSWKNTRSLHVSSQCFCRYDMTSWWGGWASPQLLNFSRKLPVWPAASSLGAHPALDPKKFANPCCKITSNVILFWGHWLTWIKLQKVDCSIVLWFAVVVITVCTSWYVVFMNEWDAFSNLTYQWLRFCLFTKHRCRAVRIVFFLFWFKSDRIVELLFETSNRIVIVGFKSHH